MRYFRLIKPIPHLAINAGEPNGAIFGFQHDQVYLMGEVITWLHHSLFDLNPDSFKEIFIKYKIGDKVKITAIHGKDKYGEVINILPFENKMTIRYDDLKSIEVLNLNSLFVKKCYIYWFINSEGKFCKMTEDKTKPEVLKYRKEIGNYFSSIDEAKKYKTIIVKKETND